MTEPEAPDWGGDPSIAWRILLTAAPAPPLTPEDVTARLAALFRDQGWGTPPPVTLGDAATLCRDLAEIRDVPVVVGLAENHLVVSAFHAYVDGLGLLEVLAALTGAATTSSARGVGDRPVESGGMVGRLREVAFAPPAPVTPPAVTPADGDAFASRTVPGPVRNAALVHAAVAAVVAHNTAHGRPSRHVTVGVGAGRPAAPGERLANRSELIRLRDLEGLTPSAVEDALRSTPLSAAGGSGSGSGRLTTVALGVLAPRLGSTLLVSHLGEVTTVGANDLAFYPVTAGGSGLSLGAVGHAGSTTLTLRGRGAAWDSPALQGLLDRLCAGIVRA